MNIVLSYNIETMWKSFSERLTLSKYIWIVLNTMIKQVKYVSYDCLSWLNISLLNFKFKTNLSFHVFWWIRGAFASFWWHLFEGNSSPTDYDCFGRNRYTVGCLSSSGFWIITNFNAKLARVMEYRKSTTNCKCLSLEFRIVMKPASLIERSQLIWYHLTCNV